MDYGSNLSTVILSENLFTIRPAHGTNAKNATEADSPLHVEDINWTLTRLWILKIVSYDSLSND